MKNNISISLWLQRYKTYKSPPPSSLTPRACYMLAHAHRRLHTLEDEHGQSSMDSRAWTVGAAATGRAGGRVVGGCPGIGPQVPESLLLAQILHRPWLVLFCSAAPQE